MNLLCIFKFFAFTVYSLHHVIPVIPKSISIIVFAIRTVSIHQMPCSIQIGKLFVYTLIDYLEIIHCPFRQKTCRNKPIPISIQIKGIFKHGYPNIISITHTLNYNFATISVSYIISLYWIKANIERTIVYQIRLIVEFVSEVAIYFFHELCYNYLYLLS